MFVAGHLRHFLAFCMVGALGDGYFLGLHLARVHRVSSCNRAPMKDEVCVVALANELALVILPGLIAGGSDVLTGAAVHWPGAALCAGAAACGSKIP